MADTDRQEVWRNYINKLEFKYQLRSKINPKDELIMDWDFISTDNLSIDTILEFVDNNNHYNVRNRKQETLKSDEDVRKVEDGKKGNIDKCQLGEGTSKGNVVGKKGKTKIKEPKRKIELQSDSAIVKSGHIAVKGLCKEKSAPNSVTEIDDFATDEELSMESTISIDEKLNSIEEILIKYNDQDKVDFTNEDFSEIINFIINDLESPICEYIYHRDEAMFLENEINYNKFYNAMKEEIQQLKQLFTRRIVHGIMRKISSFIYRHREAKIEEDVELELGQLLKDRETNVEDETTKQEIIKRYEILKEKYPKRALLWHCLRVQTHLSKVD